MGKPERDICPRLGGKGGLPGEPGLEGDSIDPQTPAVLACGQGQPLKHRLASPPSRIASHAVPSLSARTSGLLQACRGLLASTQPASGRGWEASAPVW